jgi:hypothetical protein
MADKIRRSLFLKVALYYGVLLALVAGYQTEI